CEISEETLQTLDLSTAENGNKGDEIKCSERVYDNYNWSNWYNSSNTASISNTAPTIDNPQTDTWSFTIANTAPTTPTTLTLTDPIKISETLTATASGSIDADSDDITYYVNDTVVSINSGTGLINDTITTESETGSYSINVICGDSYDNTSQTFVYTIKDGTAPITKLIVPIDNYWNDSATSVDVNFTCNATDGYNLKNISLYITDSSNVSFSFNSSKDITGTYNWSNWTLSLSVGNYTWNCLTYDEYDNSDWADDNRSLMMNYTVADAPP
ncbi:unnamed protein product, partial [marine sediment metagenome]